MSKTYYVKTSVPTFLSWKCSKCGNDNSVYTRLSGSRETAGAYTSIASTSIAGHLSEIIRNPSCDPVGLCFGLKKKDCRCAKCKKVEFWANNTPFNLLYLLLVALIMVGGFLFFFTIGDIMNNSYIPYLLSKKISRIIASIAMVISAYVLKYLVGKIFSKKFSALPEDLKPRMK